MQIRKAEMADLPRMMEIYAQAREYMRRSGNPNQWIKKQKTPRICPFSTHSQDSPAAISSRILSSEG